MAEKTRNEKLKEITDGIADGIKSVFTSEKFKNYLKTMSKFHNYSLNNITLIHIQRPDATLVSGFQDWKRKFGRHVKAGEKGIKIIAPIPVKKKREKLDPDTKLPMRDKDGNIIMEEQETVIPFYKIVTVFDVSQTEGKPLPSLASDLTGNVQQYEIFMEALRRSSPVPITFEPMDENKDGYFRPSEQRIAIREGMSQVQTVCATVHEIAHSKLHNNIQQSEPQKDGKQEPPKDRNTMETEAEAVSYTVCQYFSIETGENSFGYLASWAKDKELPELKASLTTIRKASSELINDIDRHFAEICKEKGIDLSATHEEAVSEQNIPDASANETLQAAPIAQEAEATQKASAVIESPENQRTVDTPKQFAADYADFMENLYSARFIKKPPFRPSFTRNEIINDITADILIGIFPKFRFVLNAVKEIPDAPSPQDLLQRLDNLENGWNICQSRYPENTTCYNLDDIFHIYVVPLENGYDYFLTDTNNMDFLQVGYLSDKDFMLTSTPERDAFVHIITARGVPYEPDIVKKIPLGPLEKEVSEPERQEEPTVAESPDEPVTDEPTADTPAPAVDAPTTSVESLPLDEYPLPDPALTMSDLATLGYNEDDLLPLTQERAGELIDKDFSVYVISNGAAEMMFDREEIDSSDIGTVFAVPRDEWEASKDFDALIQARLEHQDERETAFLNHDGDCFAIYQLKDGDATRDIRFESLDYVKAAGQAVERNNYDLVYTATLTNAHDLDNTLNKIYDQFNINRPSDYHSHSVSMSDIIALKLDGVVTYNYVDRYGFQQIPDFLLPENYLKNAEMAMEDDYSMLDGIINNGPKQPTVAELEQQVKDGKSISLMDLASAVHSEKRQKKAHENKPSVLKQLKQKPKQENKKSERKKSAEREL